MHSKIHTLFTMTRPKNIAIAVMTLIVGDLLLGYFPNIEVFVLQEIGFAAAIGFANIQNDILDLESDKLNRPERPLVTGQISVVAAQKTWKILAIVMIFCGLGDFLISYFGNISIESIQLTWQKLLYFSFPFWFFIFLGTFLIAYNRWLKHVPLLKNMTVALLCATPLFYAIQHFIIFNQTNTHPIENIWAIVPAIPFALLLTTAREIYKDLEDESGDLKAGIMTFPLIAGSATARKFAGSIIIFTWISLPIPVFFMDKVFGQNYPSLFLVITEITLIPCFAYILFQAHKKQYRQAQSTVKTAMFLGLIALVICSLL